MTRFPAFAAATALAMAPVAAAAEGDKIEKLDGTMSTQAAAASIPALGGLSTGALVAGAVVVVAGVAIAVDDSSSSTTSTPDSGT